MDRASDAAERAREFEASSKSICKRVNQADLNVGRRDDVLTTQEREELRRLRRENCILPWRHPVRLTRLSADPGNSRPSVAGDSPTTNAHASP